MKKIVFIHPVNDPFYCTPWIRQNKCPPTGLLLLAAIIQRNVPDTEVLVLDYIDDVTPFLNGADIVGVSSIYTNHQNCLKILNQAKQLGAQTWIGGMNATALAKQILTNHSYVDYVFLGDAEDAVLSMLSGKNPASINNLALRNHVAQVVINELMPIAPNQLFDLRPLIPFDHLRPNRQAPFNISSIRGCIKAVQSKRCSFCALQHQHLRLMPPTMVWQQIDLLQKHGFSYFEESGDCFIVGNYPTKLLACRPQHLSDVTFKIYIRPEQVTRKNLEILKALNVVKVFLGMESFDDLVLAKANRKTTETQIMQAINLLSEYAFGLHLPFIWGLPGTSKRTLEKNLSLADYVLPRVSDLEFLSSLAVPLVGSSLFSSLSLVPEVLRQYPGDLQHDDIIDYKILIQLQTQLLTSVSYEELLSCMQTMQLKSSHVGGFGV